MPIPGGKVIRKVVRFPDSLLTKKSEPIEKIDEEIKTLAADMIDTMKAENGIGISAVQVGVLKRIMVVSVRKSTTHKDLIPEVMINPKILSKEGFQRLGEGCLSVPGLILPIDRYDWIEVEYQELDGSIRKALLQGLESVCFQHELDHLEGIVFIDRGGVGKLRGKLG